MKSHEWWKLNIEDDSIILDDDDEFDCVNEDYIISQQ